MHSDNEKSANSGRSGTGLVETPTDENSVASLGEGLIASDGSHLGSISAHSLNPESIGDPLEDEFIDQGHQEGVSGGGNLADETIDLGLEFGVEQRIVGNGDIGEVGGGDNVPKGRFIPHQIINNQRLFLCLLILRQQER
jgi:hypothetical protein